MQTLGPLRCYKRRDEPRDPVLAIPRRRPGLLLGDRAGSTFVEMVERAVRCANPVVVRASPVSISWAPDRWR